MSSLHEQMSPILRRLADDLVEATPEWWHVAAMRVEIKRNSDTAVGIAHSIWSDEHPNDVVVATDEIFEQTRLLQQLCDNAGQPWSALDFRIKQIETGWQFTTDFQYTNVKCHPDVC